MGLDLEASGNFILNWITVSKNIAGTHWPSLVIALITLTTMILIKRWRRQWPNMLIAMIMGSIATQLLLLSPWQAAKQTALVGEIPSQLPPLSMPVINWDVLRELAPGAMALAFWGCWKPCLSPVLYPLGQANTLMVIKNSLVNPCLILLAASPLAMPLRGRLLELASIMKQVLAALSRPICGYFSSFNCAAFGAFCGLHYPAKHGCYLTHRGMESD